MSISSLLLKQALKQAAIEVGKSAGSEIKSGIKEVASEKGKQVGENWTESTIEKAKQLGQDDEYLIPVEDAMEILRAEKPAASNKSDIDWTKEQLSQLSDKEFIRLVTRIRRAKIDAEDEIEIVDSTPLDKKELHTNYSVISKDLELMEEIEYYLTISRYNDDLTEGSPEILASSLFDYIEMYGIDIEMVVVYTQESVDEYFKLEALSKYGIKIIDGDWIQQDACNYNIEIPS